MLAAGPLIDVAMAVKRATEANAAGPLLVFDDSTGHVIDLDLRGSKTDIEARLSQTMGADAVKPQQRLPRATSAAQPADAAGRGRPKLGVVGREVTLLPQQWEWLASQPGGASVTLRKLVETARRNGAAKDKIRMAQDAAYAFLLAIAGNMPGYEDATRALFAHDRPAFEHRIADWPDAVRRYAIKLAFGTAVTPDD
jgi:Uncharacterized protein conserved in bacteria